MRNEQTAVLMTSDELFALPEDDGVERWLVRGELRERPLTKRSPDHTKPTALISYWLLHWALAQPHPQGEVHAGEAYFRLRRDPETNVGIDVAFAPADLVASRPPRGKFFDGPPLLAVEILSPSDKQEDIDDGIAEYLACGVRLVWIVDPADKTVIVYRPGALPEMFNLSGELIGDPDMPGLRIRVRDIFR